MKRRKDWLFLRTCIDGLLPPVCSVLIEFGLRFEDSRGRAISSVDWVVPQIVRGERPRGQGLVLEDVLPQLWTGFVCCPALVAARVD